MQPPRLDAARPGGIDDSRPAEESINLNLIEFIDAAVLDRVVFGPAGKLQPGRHRGRMRIDNRDLDIGPLGCGLLFLQGLLYPGANNGGRGNFEELTACPSNIKALAVNYSIGKTLSEASLGSEWQLAGLILADSSVPNVTGGDVSASPSASGRYN
ncbi:hypothetical protein ALT_7209 [Aspergillus lentulus]|uniref:Uncharacterized protein n=1 Tax=Aspergillus lentulus TaxID=293939 RepID=A0AAN4PNI0_ASPLE|nr:uncharacterized protein IFM58399_02826 [Aspergillus lentulus]KAF4181221.1 hypothetical protein CNMCM7927_000716 [Aspergillus lentulus]GAQ09888.1 hypothetical protein ALT_7209 [Aspergillus lentulus]GFF31252.1 hypothetical protein IFM58399_02826 [Aspergillus lentulus]GFF65705.1 hypothetical protein IFM62136_06383 [Aspergillus lentulus]GFG06213.1 hypothetical protein IFM61392_04228 [Aspergillus lentulus]